MEIVLSDDTDLNPRSRPREGSPGGNGMPTPDGPPPDGPGPDGSMPTPDGPPPDGSMPTPDGPPPEGAPPAGDPGAAPGSGE